MAIIERPVPATVTRGATVATPSSSLGVFRRPVMSTGWRAWAFTVDHKKLGIMYGVSAMVFFIVGGIEAMLIRAQLAGPNGTVLSADTYNAMFTMHGTTMIFLFAMPMAAAFANYMVPLQIGARDVAFPRINAFGLLVLPVRRALPDTSWLLGGGADGGWFMYRRTRACRLSPSNGNDSGRSACRSPASRR
jgi:cytochrome c oxidase subunit 1